MRSIESRYEERLASRRENQSLRTLKRSEGLVDLSSNDYLSLARARTQTEHLGATGSRLLSGNDTAHEETEHFLAQTFGFEEALLFPSGYTANLGLLSCIAQKGDTILYDSLSHASIRDGLRLSVSKSWAFDHNDLTDLERFLVKAEGEVFVVVESVYSISGHRSPLKAIAELTKKYNAHLIVDEAHATGVVGRLGLVQKLGLTKDVFASVVTCGKAYGTDGAFVLGSSVLKQYLVNFCRSFIYTTAMSPAHACHLAERTQLLMEADKARNHLWKLIELFERVCIASDIKCVVGQSAIQAIEIPGNDHVRKVASKLRGMGWDLFPILHPTVPKGQECLRISIHAHNTMEEINSFMEDLSNELHNG